MYSILPIDATYFFNITKRLIEIFYGKYDWSGLRGETYRSYFKRVKNM